MQPTKVLIVDAHALFRQGVRNTIEPEGEFEVVGEAEVLEQIVFELVNLTRRLQSQNATEQMRVLLLKICYYIDQYRPIRLKAALALERQPVLVEPRLESRPLAIQLVSG